MPNVQITDLPAALPLDGTELIPIVQSGITVRTTTGQVATSPNLQQTFLTKNLEPSLPNSRYLSTGTGLGLTDGGAQAPLTITLNGASGSLEAAGNGLIAKTASNAVTARSIAVSGAGLSITNGDGVAGNPTLSLSGLAAAFANLGGTGIVAVQSGTTVGGISILGTAGQINVANGNGVGNPTISLQSTGVTIGSYGSASSVATFTVDDYGRLTAAGSTAIAIDTSQIVNGQLPVLRGGTGSSTPNGALTNLLPSQTSQSGKVLATDGTNTYWAAAGVGSVTSIDVSGGSTGLTTSGGPITTSGTITLGGTLNVPSGGTGATTLTGYVIGNGTSTMTASATIPTTDLSGTISNAQLANSSITINGGNVSLGGSITVTATASNALTIGTGLSGGSYDGSTPVTIAIDSTVATLTGTQTLTNKSMSGASNTFTNIPNNALSNYTISGVALGGTLFPLTIGTGLSGGSYDGSGNVTVAIDSTVATLTGTQTLTNKSISGSTNTLSNIPNSALTNSSITIGSTSISLGGTATTLAGLTSITLTQDPVSDLQVATKQYVDSIASGLNYHQPVNYASTAALPAYTYNNGASGVGATITANANGALSFGGGSPTAGQRLLVKDEAGANQPYNGIYVVTSAGSAGSPFVLTRATDYDTSGTGTNEIDAGDYVLVISGTNASTAWVQQTPLPIIVGTTGIVFLQFNAPITYTAGTGLNLSPATTFNISNTGVTAASYGSASAVGTFTVNAQGQLTSAATTSISINGNQITSGTVGSSYISGSYTGITGVGTLTAGTWNATVVDAAYGGTGLSSYTTGDLLYATGSTTIAKLPIGTSTQILTSSGTAPQWTSGSSISVGTATNLAGGSTGAIAYQSGAGATTFLSLGTTNYVLTAGATAPQYVAQSTLSVGSATNATNAANVAVTASSTNAAFYPAFFSATTGNLPVAVDSDLTYNPSTNTLATGTVTATTGIFGGTF
jgi:hypothetical protein